ncbi:MAG: insulinase family protein [Oscillospiraceae bacterium]|nr:insulinase family protein [Candidatus Limimonas coprohippi]MCQ2487797.1 insulinase family protein [Clostridia bacterium]
MKNIFETREIAPGVRLCSYDTDRFTTGRISINIAVPLASSTCSATAMVPFVLSHSCEEYPSYIELNKCLANLYGASIAPALTKVGDTQVIRLSMTMLGNKFALDGEDVGFEAAKLLFSLVFKPNAKDGAFATNDFESERRLCLERIDNDKNDKRAYAKKRLIEEMFEGEPYALNPIGDHDEVENVSSAEVYDVYKSIIKTGRIQVNVAGSANVDDIADLLLSYIDEIEREPVMLFTSVLYEAEEVKRVEEELPVNQGKLCMGFRAGIMDPDEDYAKKRIMTDLFGGGTYSRLFSVVREKMSLCYYCSSLFMSTKGFILVQSGVENKNAEIAIEEIQNQLKYVAESITEEDLKTSKRSLLDKSKTVCDLPETIDAWLFGRILDEEVETPEEYADKIMAVTLEEVKEAASTVTLDTIYLLKGTEEAQS